MKHETREGNIKWDKNVEKQVSKDQSPHVEEQSGSKVSVLWRQERIDEKGRKL